MCFKKPVIIQGKTVEEIIAEKSAGMSDAEKAQYWLELNQNIFALLGKVEINLFKITINDWLSAAQKQYPSLVDLKFADYNLQTTDLAGITAILKRDWSNLLPFKDDLGDCDDFATRLYSHLCDYYELNALIPIWGDTTRGYHGFNLAVVYENGILIARLIEPQSDDIFIEEGPLGKYIPRQTAMELGIKRIKI